MSIRVIVVDNSEELKEKLTRILEETEGVDVLGSFDGAKEAMDFLDGQQVELVFSDVVMPDISGITMAAKLYERKNHPEVVLMSGIPGFSLETWKIKAFRFVGKPYTRAQVVKVIQEYIHIWQERISS